MQCDGDAGREPVRGGETFLLALSDRLRRIDDPLGILGEAAAALGTHLGASRAGYAKVDADTGIFTIERDWTDGTVKPGNGRRTMASFGAETTAMLYRGETQCITDARTDPRVRPENRAAFEEMRIEAAVTVPLVKDGRLVAMFSVQKSAPRTWHDAEVRLIEEVAERTWAAHERARANLSLLAAERRRSFLLDISDRLRGETDPIGVLGLAAEAIGEFFGARHVFFAEMEENGEYASVPHSWSDGSQPPRGGRYPLAIVGEEVLARYRSGETMFVDDLDAGPDMPESLRASFRAAGVRSYVTVPFMAAGRLMGTLSVQMAAPRVWTPEDVELIEAAVERTWEAMQRARAQLALRESEATLAFLLELGDRMRDRTAAADILRDAVEAIGRRLAANRVGYAEIDSVADVLTVDVEWGDGTLPPIAGRHPLAAFGRVHLESLGRGETARIDDVDHSAQVDASNRPAIDAMDIRAAITVPLVRRGELVALLSVHHGTPRAWTDGEVRLVEEVAERTWSTVERARAEAELRESQKLLAAFMENAPVGMYLKDESGRYVMANAGMDRIFGRPASEAIGRHADELFDETTRGKIVAQDRIALNDGRAQVAEQFLPGGAEESWTLVIRFPVDLGAQGKRIGGFAIDLSEQKRAEADLARSREALYQSEKLTALGSLLAGVSHELNNPLSIVVAQAVMMEEDTEGSPLSVRAAKIRNAAERCAKIVQTFLAMARQKSPQRQRVDMNAVVRGALELTAYGLRSNGVELDCRLADQLPTVEGDADQLHQVIANLIVNAQQALQEVLHPRQLRVTTRRGAAGTIEVELADNGPGVPAEYRRRLFEPFFTTKPQGAGTGLGLSFSLGVAEAHGGTLELVDTEDGAAFRLTLPAGLVQAAAPEAAAGPAPAPSRGDALVVDDEVDIAEIVAELLGKQGYRVQVARSGAEAKRQLSARDFDLVLSDLRMPDVDGPALHAWIASQKPHLLDRLGFVTGDTMGPNAVRFLETSGCPTLEKPFTPRSFRDFVGRIHPEEVA